MANVAESFPKAEFDGIAFYYTDLTVKGGIRFAQHEFPHTAGAEIEKLGRKPYVVTFTALMHYVKGSQLDRDYPELYPTKNRQLREKFEKEISADLVVPTIGVIRAVATAWTGKFDVRQSSGETVTLEFIEDTDGKESFDDQTSDFGVTAMTEANDAAQAAAAIADFKKAATQSIFQDINDAITKVQGVFGQADAYSRLVEGKIQAVVNLCIYADSQIEELQHPEHHLVLNALKDLWTAAKDLGENVVQSRLTMREFTLPKAMTIAQISAQLYGSTEKSFEILQLNTFEDNVGPIPPGTVVRYLK